MRISEVANLKLEHVAHDEITIEAYATQPGRTVVLNSAARFLIEDYLRVRPNTNASIFLFVSKNGKQLAVGNIRAAIDRYMLKAEMPNYSVNDLRNTFIVENLKRGVDLVTISQAVGHRRISTTERYVELAGINEAGKKQKLETL
jgi:integrase/recombinase XerC/integrase/recombinase XerD